MSLCTPDPFRNSIGKGNTYYYYDKAGNLTSVVYPASPSISFAYDALNRLTTMVDGVGTTQYGYDAVGQLLSEDGPWNDDIVTYTYNNRLRTSLNLEAPNADLWVQTYAYDDARRLTNTTSPAGAFGYQYASPCSLLTSQLTLPSGAYVTNIYDSMARLTTNDLINSSGAILDMNWYAYNVGNQRFAQWFVNTNRQLYTYDNIGQLTSERGTEFPGLVTNRLQEQVKWSYDAAHNLSIRTNNALVQTFTVNDLNELSSGTHTGTLTVAGTTWTRVSSVTVNGLAAIPYEDATFAATNFTITNGNNTFTAVAHDSLGRSATNSVTSYLPATNSFMYDTTGNLLSDSWRTFTYDDENELTSVVVSNGISTPTLTSNIYDGKMRRRIRKDYAWQGAWVQTAEIHYIYDGNVVIQERDGNNLPTISYTRGVDLSGSLQGGGGIGGLLARTDNRLSTINSPLSTSFYHADGNGNITSLISYQQYILAPYEYDPFGNIVSESGSLADANAYRFSSKEFDKNNGLICYLYRFYDPTLQRWPNRDPLLEGGFEVARTGFAVQSTFSLPIGEAFQPPNLYEFVGDNPASKIDALGLAFGGVWHPNQCPLRPLPCSRRTCAVECIAAVGICKIGCASGCLLSEAAWLPCYKTCNTVCSEIAFVCAAACAACPNP